jgi:hypothetical protein
MRFFVLLSPMPTGKKYSCVILNHCHCGGAPKNIGLVNLRAVQKPLQGIICVSCDIGVGMQFAAGRSLKIHA